MNMIFFKPNTAFVKWLIKYANNRVIIDAGAGEKFLLSQQLIANGATKVVAIDPFIDYNEFMKWRTLNMGKDVSFHVMPNEIQKMAGIYSGDNENVTPLIVFARPCHSSFVEDTLKLKGKNVEVLYITKPENLDEYCDLGIFDDRKVLVEHEGSSADNEVVYSII